MLSPFAVRRAVGESRCAVMAGPEDEKSLLCVPGGRRGETKEKGGEAKRRRREEASKLEGKKRAAMHN